MVRRHQALLSGDHALLLLLVSALQAEGRCFSRYGDVVINGFFSDFEQKKVLSIGELILTAGNFLRCVSRPSAKGKFLYYAQFRNQ